MNNKEFIARLSSKVELSPKEAQIMSDTLIAGLTMALEDGNNVTIQNFGSFEVKKKLERIVVNPTTKQKMLVPPKLALAFKPSNGLKEKLK